MDGLPFTICPLDPPLHEFLPEGDVNEIVAELASDTGAIADEVFSCVEELPKVNPMLGFRGSTLGISYVELTEMQGCTIFEDAIAMTDHGVKVLLEIIVPLVRTPQELGNQVNLVHSL
eukprot:Gb_23527 [translate_table: standard]